MNKAKLKLHTTEYYVNIKREIRKKNHVEQTKIQEKTRGEDGNKTMM